MSRPSISQVFSKGIQATLNNYGVLIVNNLLMATTIFLSAITVIGIILVPSIAGGYQESLIRICRGETVRIGDFFKKGFNKFGSLLGAALLYILGISIGCILLLIPGIYLMIAWYFVILLIVDQKYNCKISETFGKSRNIIHGIAGWWHTSLFIGIIVLIYLAIEIILFVLELFISPVIGIIFRILVFLTIYPFFGVIVISFYNDTVSKEFQ